MIKHSLPKVFLLGILVSILVSCSRFPFAPDDIAKINLSELLVTSQDLPVGWLQYGIPLSPASKSEYMDSGTDSIEIDFYSDLVPDDNPLSEQIYRSSGFNSIGRAKDNYNYLEKDLAYGSTPLNWKFKSQFADNSDFTCRPYRDDSNPPASNPLCEWIARYNHIVIYVEAYLVPSRMTLSDLENIIQKIDAKAGKVILGK